MNYLDLSSYQIESINHEHIHTVDKLYRIHDGISSNLISVKDGVALLEVEIHSGWEKTNEVTAKQFINSWNDHNPDLQEVDFWEVRIYTSEKISGFTISPNDINSPQLERKLDRFNADAQRYLLYIYKVYSLSIEYPLITLRDGLDKYNLELPATVVCSDSSFYNLRESKNYIFINGHISGNLFIVPHEHEDYLLISMSEHEKKPEVKFLKASEASVTYSIHRNFIYLINLSKEESARLFWEEYIRSRCKIEVLIDVKNC